MGSTFEKFKLRDAASYDGVTRAFDQLTARLSAPLVDRMVSLADLAPGERILDIGTGTGIVALQAAPRLSPGGRVLGVDLSEGMLAAAAAKAAQAGLNSRIEFCRMDAESLALKDASFDAVLSLYALFHFPHPPAALREMFRVLRPAGRLVLGVGTGAPLFSWTGLAHRFGRLPRLWLRLRGRRLTAPDFLNALVAKHLPDNLEREVPSWVKKRGDMTGVVGRFVRQAGFDPLRSCWLGREFVLETAEEFWEVQATFSSFARKRLSQAPEAAVRLLREEFFHRCRQVQARGGKLTYPVGAFYVVAQRPGP